MLEFGLQKGIIQALIETRDCQFDENPHQVTLNIRVMVAIGEAIVFFRMQTPNIVTDAIFNRIVKLAKSGLIPEESEPAIIRLSYICVLCSFCNTDGGNCASMLFLNGVFDILLTFFDRESHERCENLGILLYMLAWMMGIDPTIRDEFQKRQFHNWILRRVEMTWDEVSGLYLAVLSYLCDGFDECGIDIVESGFIGKLRDLLLTGSFILKRGAASIIGGLAGMVGRSEIVGVFFENEKEVVDDMLQLVVDSGGNDVWLVNLMDSVREIVGRYETGVSERCRTLLASLADEKGSEMISVGCIAEAILEKLNTDTPDAVE
jgi:hypothetical protein